MSLSNEQVFDILESISDGFISMDNQLVVIYFNKTAEEMLGRKREEVLGKNLFEAFPEAKVAPYLVVGATDSRHFKGISDQIFRFSPIRISPSNVKSFHGLNERIAVSDFHSSVQFYMQLVRNTHQELN